MNIYYERLAGEMEQKRVQSKDMMSRFRALYLAVIAVIGVGVSGSVILPKAQLYSLANPGSLTATPNGLAGDVRQEAGKYLLRMAASRLYSSPQTKLSSRPAEEMQMAYAPSPSKFLNGVSDLVPFED